MFDILRWMEPSRRASPGQCHKADYSLRCLQIKSGRQIFRSDSAGPGKAEIGENEYEHPASWSSTCAAAPLQLVKRRFTWQFSAMPRYEIDSRRWCQTVERMMPSTVRTSSGKLRKT